MELFLEDVGEVGQVHFVGDQATYQVWKSLGSDIVMAFRSQKWRASLDSGGRVILNDKHGTQRWRCSPEGLPDITAFVAHPKAEIPSSRGTYVTALLEGKEVYTYLYDQDALRLLEWEKNPRPGERRSHRRRLMDNTTCDVSKAYTKG